MPGLIDAHWHAMMAAAPLDVLMTADVGYINLIAADEARRTLMRGFTSVRDMAGPTFGLKRAIDGSLAAGPRIWPSGAISSQTGGHGDFRLPYEIPARRMGRWAAATRWARAAMADGATTSSCAPADGSCSRGPVRACPQQQRLLELRSDRRRPVHPEAVPRAPSTHHRKRNPMHRARLYAARDSGTDPPRRPAHRRRVLDQLRKLIADNAVWLSTRFPDDDSQSSVQRRRSKGSWSTPEQHRPTASPGAAGATTAWAPTSLFDPMMTARPGRS